MDYDKLIDAVKLCGSTPKVDQCKQCAYWSGGDMSKCIPRMTTAAATALSTLQAENEKLRDKLARVTAEREAAVEAVKNMAEYIVCAGRVDYYLCDEISQEHHLKYQPKNDGNYDNEPCYKCIADWFLQGHEWQGNCW